VRTAVVSISAAVAGPENEAIMKEKIKRKEIVIDKIALVFCVLNIII